MLTMERNAVNLGGDIRPITDQEAEQFRIK